MRVIIFFLIASTVLSCSGTSNTNSAVKQNASTPGTPAEIPTYTYEVVRSYPHDGKAFTQGLVFHNGSLYESTGQYGESTIRKVEIETGKVLQKHDLPREVFAEGLALLNTKLFQITWQENIAYEYDVNGLKLLREMQFEGAEGWGLTTDGKNLIMSDGTHLLHYIDPQSFKTIKRVAVFQSPGKPLFLLNELEWVNGEIWANIWHSEQTDTSTYQGRLPNINRPNTIARIDPTSGNVIGWIDLAGISPDDTGRDEENTLNGIAYDADGDRIFITGKKWKKLYEIKIKPKV